MTEDERIRIIADEVRSGSSYADAVALADRWAERQAKDAGERAARLAAILGLTDEAAAAKVAESVAALAARYPGPKAFATFAGAYIYVRDDPEFARITKELDEYTLDFVEQRLYGLIQTGDTAATIFFLKTRGKARGYVERQELTGPNGAPLSMLHMTMNDVKAELPKQALADIYGALVAAGGQGGRESPATFFAKGRGAVDVKSNGKAKTKNEPPRATTARK